MWRSTLLLQVIGVFKIRGTRKSTVGAIGGYDVRESYGSGASVLPDPPRSRARWSATPVTPTGPRGPEIHVVPIKQVFQFSQYAALPITMPKGPAMTTITALRVEDIRFPTSQFLQRARR